MLIHLLIKYLFHPRIEIIHYIAEGCTVDAINYAAAKGHLSIVNWLHYNRPAIYKYGYTKRSI